MDWVCEVVGAPESVAEAVTDSLGEDDWDALLPCERVPEGEEVDKPDAVEDGVTLPEGVEVPLGVSLEDTAWLGVTVRDGELVTEDVSETLRDVVALGVMDWLL